MDGRSGRIRGKEVSEVGELSWEEMTEKKAFSNLCRLAEGRTARKTGLDWPAERIGTETFGGRRSW